MRELPNSDFAANSSLHSEGEGTVITRSQLKERGVMSKRFDWSVSRFSRAIGSRRGRIAIAVGIALLPAQLPAQQLTPSWVLSTLAGNGNQTSDSGDGGPAISAAIGKAYGVARDKVGNIYVVNDLDVVRKITPDGIISTVAGTSGQPGYSGDGGPSTNALLNSPFAVAIDSDENLLIADTSNSIIRKVDVTTGIITTFAGMPKTAGYAGDGGAATSAKLNSPIGVVADRIGNVYIADHDNYRIRKVDKNGIITTIAGDGVLGNSGNGGPALQAEFNYPWRPWVDPAGNIYFTDVTNSLVRMIDTNGIMHAVAGTGVNGYSGDGGPATSAELDSPRVGGDGNGNIYIVNENSYILQRIDSNGIITTIGGTPKTSGTTGDGGPATAGKFWYPYGLDLDSSNNIYVAEASSARIRRLSQNTNLPATAVGASAMQNLFVQSTTAVTPTAGIVTPSPGEFTLGALSGCTLGSELAANTPCGTSITFQPSMPGLQTAKLSFTDSTGNVSAIGLTGLGMAPQASFGLAAISTIAGNGTTGYAGTGGPAASAQLSAPRGGVIDSAANIYFADSGNNVIRRIDGLTGIISTVAGTGTRGYSGDGSAAISALLNAPAKVVVDAAGDLYIADTGNNAVRFVDVMTGVISTIAGTGTADYTGDGGAATAATLNGPQGLAVDLGGHVYVADTGNNVIRYFGKGGNMTTLVGTGVAGYSGDGFNCYTAALNTPQSVAIGANDAFYIADTGNNVIRFVSTTNQISTFAGQQGNAANSGDGGAATAAAVDQPSDIGLDAAGDLYIAAGGQVRVIDTTGVISTLAGTGAAGDYSGEGGPATNAVIPAPISNILLDSAGDIILADTAANRLLKVDAATPISLNLGIQAPGTTGTATTIPVRNTGNSALNITGITATAGFTLPAGRANACTTTTSLAPGQSCLLNVILSPTSSANGAVTGTLTLTDNTLNGTGVAQIFTLIGATRPISFTTTSLNMTPSVPVYGTPVTLTATITNGSSPTGTVNFSADGSVVGTQTVSGNQATLILASLPAGLSKITATYSGDNNNSASVGNANLLIQPAGLTVSATNLTMPAGTTPQGFTYSITGFVNGETTSVVTGAPSEVTTAASSSPQGSTYPLTISQGTLAAANYTFTFVNGTVTIGPTPTPDFLLSTTPTTVSITAGQPYVATVTLTPLYNYTGTVKISCTSSPQGLGCSGGTLTGAGGPLTGNGQGSAVWTQITIGGTGASFPAATSAKAELFSSQRFYLAMPLGLLGILGGLRRRRSLGKLLCLVLLAIVTAGVTSCSGSSVTTSMQGSYQVTVTATDTSSNVSDSTPITITLR
jgi:hypothetical protein